MSSRKRFTHKLRDSLRHSFRPNWRHSLHRARQRIGKSHTVKHNKTKRHTRKSTSISKSHRLPSEFIFFGCWNKGICDISDTKNGMSKVFKAMKEKEDPDFWCQHQQ